MAVNVNGDGALTFDAWINNSQFKAQIDEMERRLKGLTDKANEESNAIENLARKAALAIGGYLSLSQATDFIQKMVQVRGEFQQLEVAFTTMLGSKEKADKLLAEVAELSAKTPFGLQDAAQGTKQLLAYGFAAEDITGTLTMLGNIASGLSIPLNDIVYLYGTLRTQGRAYSQDIKQFTARGIDIVGQLAKQFGIESEDAANKVNELVSAGKVGFPEIEKAFRSLTSEGGMFFNLMEEQSKTLTGRISNLEDAFTLMLNDIGKSTEGIAYTTISVLNTIVDNYQTVLDVIGILIATYGTYRAAIIAVNIVEGIRTAIIGVNTAGLGAMTVAEYLHYQALVIVEKAQKLLNATMLSNPYVAVATALAALAATLIIFRKEAIEAKDAQELLKDSSKDIADTLDKQKSSVDAYVSILRDANSTEKERIAAMEKLAAINPKIVEGLNAQAISQEKLTENVELYLESLRNKLALEANQKAVTESIGLEGKLSAEVKSTSKLLEEYQKKLTESTSARLPQQFVNQIQYEVDRLNNRLAEQTAQYEKQRATTKALAKGEIEDEAKKADAVKKTNEQLIREAQSLEDLKAVRKDIEEQYEKETVAAKKLQLVQDLTLSDKRRKELDPYGNLKKSAKEATKDASKLRAVIDQINAFESNATSVIEGSQEGKIEKLQNDGEKLIAAVKRLKLASAEEQDLIQRIEAAGNILIDNASTIIEAKRAQYELSATISEINAQINNVDPNTSDELELKKKQIEAEVQLQVRSLKDQYANEVDAQDLLQSKIAEIRANARRQQIDLEKEFARRVVDNQIDIIQRQTYKQNLKDEKILNDPTKSANEQFEAQQRILERNKKALEETLVALYNLKLSGKGDVRELNKEIDAVKSNIEEINNELSNNTKKRLIEVFSSLKDVFTAAGQSLKELSTNVSELNQPLGDALSGVADLLLQSDKLIDIIKDKSRSAEQNIAVGIQAVISLTNMVISAAAERARMEANFNQSLINQQREYNLALNEAIRLNNKLKDNVFVADFQAQIKDSIEALTDAQKQYQEAIKALSQGQAKAGLRNTISGSAVLSGIGTGAVAGAAIGSIVPVIGNAVGAVVGAVVGGIVGLFGGKKKKDSYVALLQEYPELVRQTDEGVLEINRDLAKTLIANNLVSDATKELIQDTLDWQDAIDKANEQLRSIITDLAGDLGSNLRDALVSAFEEGKDSAEAFAESVSKTLENVVSQMIFSNIFGSAFDQLQKRMQDSFAANGDMNWSDDLTDFFNKYSGLANQFNEQLAAAQQAAEQAGLDIFKNANAGADGNSLQGAIKGMSEQTAEVLAGQLGGLRLNSAQQLQVMTQNLSVLNAIKADTAYLYSIDSRLRLLETQGIKIRS